MDNTTSLPGTPDELAAIKDVMHSQNDALITIATLISAARAYARERDDSETDRLLENIGSQVNAVADAFADHV